MATLNISLPDAMRTFIENEVKRGAYSLTRFDASSPALGARVDALASSER